MDRVREEKNKVIIERMVELLLWGYQGLKFSMKFNLPVKNLKEGGIEHVFS